MLSDNNDSAHAIQIQTFLLDFLLVGVSLLYCRTGNRNDIWPISVIVILISSCLQV